jgi:hypothetical protein
MDPATVALTTAVLIGSKAAATLASEAGEKAYAAITRVYETVVKRFGSDEEVHEAISRLEDKPQSDARTAELAEVLRERLASDPKFAGELADLLRESTGPEASSFVSTVVDNASVGRVTNLGSSETTLG